MSGSVTMSSMKRIMGEQGEINVLLIPVVLLTILLIGVGVFAFWAYGGRQKYKDNAEALVSAAVTANTKQVQAQDAAQYAQAAKSPLTVYTGPDAYGSVKISYPKTWSAYIDTTNSATPLDAYFHDGYVPSTQSGQTYNLRVQVNAEPYNTVMAQYTGQIQTGTVTAAPYSLPKVPSVVGTRLTGQVLQDDPTGTGTMILLPLRSTTLEIWTESNDYLPDFNTYILPNLTFSP